MRHNVVRDTLAAEFSELKAPYNVQNLPLAVERRKDNPELVHWSGTDSVFGPLADGPLDRAPFILKEQHRCNRLVPQPRRHPRRIRRGAEPHGVGDPAHQGQDLHRLLQCLFDAAAAVRLEHPAETAGTLAHRAADVVLPDRAAP